MTDGFDMVSIGARHADPDSDGSDAATGDAPSGPLRRCIVSREVLPKEALIRFVIGPGAGIVPDLEQALPGRGLWVKADRSTLETAVAKGLFAKAARQPVEISSDLVNRVAKILTRRALNLIGLARRSGQAACGYERVRGEMAKQNVGVLLAAADGAEDGRRKLKSAAEGIPVVELFANAELAAALGRDNVVHAAIFPGRLADLLVAECKRLAGISRTCE